MRLQLPVGAEGQVRPEPGPGWRRRAHERNVQVVIRQAPAASQGDGVGLGAVGTGPEEPRLLLSQAPERRGNAHPNIVPYQVVPVADGHVIVAVGNDGQYARFVRVLGAPELARDPRFAGRLVFVEDYDINTCRHFVQGVDVWLNNPRRPLEASGTSGQKVILNGGLNLSILDGWWAEAYDGSNGFAIGDGETHNDTATHDLRDGESLYDVLKNEVIPLYYERDRDGLPRSWIKRMKRAVSTLGWRFSSDRMVMDYVTKCYVPAAGGTSSDMSRSRS